jgi:hypothetical protein
MQRYSYTICFALAALAFLGLTAPGANAEEVQFEGKFDLAFTRFSAANFPIVSSFYEGSGEATHLGKSTVEGRIDKNLSTSPATITSSGTVTAADGDQLFFAATYQKIATADPNIFDLKVTLEFTGGTGRFEGVSGDGTGTGKFNASTLKGSYVLNGTAFKMM